MTREPNDCHGDEAEIEARINSRQRDPDYDMEEEIYQRELAAEKAAELRETLRRAAQPPTGIQTLSDFAKTLSEVA